MKGYLDSCSYENFATSAHKLGPDAGDAGADSRQTKLPSLANDSAHRRVVGVWRTSLSIWLIVCCVLSWNDDMADKRQGGCRGSGARQRGVSVDGAQGADVLRACYLRAKLVQMKRQSWSEEAGWQ
jgi:hypothetical protein